jgi:ribonuclease HI
LAKIKVFTDGASRGNPGQAGIGIIVYNENGAVIEQSREYIGETTNNQAEYKALIKSLDVIKKIRDENKLKFDTVEFYADSELVVKQVNFEYQVKEPELALLNNKFHVKAKKLGISYSIQHIERALNKEADKLANIAIDAHNSNNITLFNTN